MKQQNLGATASQSLSVTYSYCHAMKLGVVASEWVSDLSMREASGEGNDPGTGATDLQTGHRHSGGHQEAPVEDERER